MLKRYAADYTNTVLSVHLSSIVKKMGSLIENFRHFYLFSEDIAYKRHFNHEYMPQLYRKHASEMFSNCVFCMHLVKTGCHKQCLKCGLGRYAQCRPLLPGLLSSESIYPYEEENLRAPWYYTETCEHFYRLPQDNYLRNFSMIFTSAAIYNYEILEGLERGILSGEKPCHVCASIDYEIYKKCSGQEDFHAFSPCRKIVGELADFYQNQNSNQPVNKEASLSY